RRRKRSQRGKAREVGRELEGHRHQIALPVIAARLLQELHLVNRLDPFRDDPETELLTHGNDGSSDTVIPSIARNVRDEGPIDLQSAHWEVSEVGETRVTSAEVDDGDPNSE